MSKISIYYMKIKSDLLPATGIYIDLSLQCQNFQIKK